jgi:hypothetical protein
MLGLRSSRGRQVVSTSSTEKHYKYDDEDNYAK